MNKKILIIEDEKPMARALELKLSHAGFEVESVPDGERGMAFLETQNVDLILLDLVMPKLDGFAVLAALKRKEAKTPIFVLTNLGQEEDERRAKELGAAEFLIKSNTPIAEIVERVKRFLQP